VYRDVGADALGQAVDQRLARPDRAHLRCRHGLGVPPLARRDELREQARLGLEALTDLVDPLKDLVGIEFLRLLIGARRLGGRVGGQLLPLPHPTSSHVWWMECRSMRSMKSINSFLAVSVMPLSSTCVLSPAISRASSSFASARAWKMTVSAESCCTASWAERC